MALPDPRKLDLTIRSVTTALIALIIVVVASWQALETGDVSSALEGWGGIIIGVYFGSHSALNGSAVRAARDQSVLAQAIEATKATPATMPPPDGPVV